MPHPATVAPIYRQIGRRVKELRVHSGMSMSEAAEKTRGVLGTSSWQAIEAGKYRPSVGALASVAWALRVDLHAILPASPRPRMFVEGF
jgi:transcriptional regulator with XRE-family HTH domain